MTPAEAISKKLAQLHEANEAILKGIQEETQRRQFTNIIHLAHQLEMNLHTIQVITSALNNR